MKWDSNNQTCIFEFASLNENSIGFNCIEAPNSEDMLKWKLQTLPEDSVVVKMTLKSHPGKAIVRDKRDDVFH